MRTSMNRKLVDILRNHKHWLDKDCDGFVYMRADLRERDLRRANLYKVDLQKSYLQYTCFRDAFLARANLFAAYLYGADMQGSNLYETDLRNTDLRKSDLRKSDLRGADLRDSDLRGSDLRDAKLQHAKLQGAKLPYIPYACPEAGAFIGFKKCRGLLIVEMEIPADAKRLSGTGRKCRCDKAKVLRIWNLDHTESDKNKAISKYDENFVYEVGKTVCVDDFEEDRWAECAPGIHFFINFQEAVDHGLMNRGIYERTK